MIFASRSEVEIFLEVVYIGYCSIGIADPAAGPVDWFLLFNIFRTVISEI